MKKRSILFVILFICVIAIPVIVLIYKMWCIEGVVDCKLETYTNNQLIQYDGGAVAMEFLPENGELQNAENIYFHYQDNRTKSTVFHRYHSFFLLDVRYSEEEYNTFTQQFDYDPELGVGGYSKVMQDSSADSY